MNNIDFRTNASVYLVLSHSKTDTRYRVVLGDDAAYDTCGCPDFKYRNPRCKHIVEARDFVDAGVVQGPATVLGTGFSIKDIGELYVRAQGWVAGDKDRAASLVEAYLKGARGEGL